MVNAPAKACLVAGGIFSLGFVIFHAFFWRIFHWRENLASLTYYNRAITQILNLCLMFVFAIMAYVSLFYSTEMLTTSLGNVLSMTFSLFWLFRLALQIIFFGWQNRISLVISFVFLLGGALYLLAVVV